MYYLRDRTGKSARIAEKIKKRIGIEVEEKIENEDQILETKSLTENESEVNQSKEINNNKNEEKKTKIEKEKK